MPDWSFPTLAYPAAVWILLIIPVVCLLWWYAARQRKKALQVWGDGAILPPRRWLGRSLLLTCLVLLAIALAGPEAGVMSMTPTTSARDLLFCIDISQSMLAEDQPPRNRLTRARSYAFQLIEHLQKQASTTRVGLAVFAGNARLLCPPTEDRVHIIELLSGLSTESLGTLSRLTDAQGGSIGTSIASVARLLGDWSKQDAFSVEFTDVVMISDGDDLQDQVDTGSFRSTGLILHALAVGDANRDWPIPQGNGYLMQVDAATGQTTRAVTRRRTELLSQITEATGGSVILEDSSPQPLVSWWKQWEIGRPVRVLQSQVRQVPVNRANWMISLAGVVLLIELALGGARQREW